MIKTFDFWNSLNKFIGIPLSTKEKIGSWFIKIRILDSNQTALLYQIRMFSTTRLQRRLTTLDENDFALVKQKLEELLKLSSQ